MDQQRFEELKRKRFEGGLSEQEADELGRMFAEEEGRPYANADMRSVEDDSPEAWRVEGDDERVRKEEEGGDAAPVDVAEGAGREHTPEEQRAVGTERQPVGSTGAGYAPPKGGTEQSG